MLGTREHAVSRSWGTPTSTGRQAIVLAYAQDTRACSELQVGRLKSLSLRSLGPVPDGPGPT